MPDIWKMGGPPNFEMSVNMPACTRDNFLDEQDRQRQQDQDFRRCMKRMHSPGYQTLDDMKGTL